MTQQAIARRSQRTIVGRRTQEVRRAIGQQIVQLRIDANLSQRQLADAAGIPQSFLSRIEHGLTEPSIAVLVAIGTALGGDVSIRFHPGTGPRIRDRIQSGIVEALVRLSRPAWRQLVEVPVWRPARGVIDLVLARPSQIIVATEVHSDIRRLEQQLRWASEKSVSLPSADAWTLLSGGNASAPISQLLVLRSTRHHRELARSFEETLRAVYPARARDAVDALLDPTRPWPGAALIWADSADGVTRILRDPPRGVTLGR